MGLRWASLLFVLAAGCSGAAESRYTWVCCKTPPALLGRGEDEVDRALTERNIDFVYGAGSFGIRTFSVSATRETLFRVRELLLKAESRGLSWPADGDLRDSWIEDQGGQAGPWTRVAAVQHRVTPTERVLDLLEEAGMETCYFFGERVDLVFVRGSDVPSAATRLRIFSLPGVETRP